MKRIIHTKISAALFVLFCLGVSLPASADEKVYLNRLADARNIFATSESLEIKAVVLQVMEWQYSEMYQDPSHAVVLKIVNDGEESLAYMGPKTFLDNMGYKFAAGEKLSIEGVLATVNGQIMMIARSYTSAGESYAIRNSEGAVLSSR